MLRDTPASQFNSCKMAEMTLLHRACLEENLDAAEAILSSFKSDEKKAIVNEN